MDGCNHSHSLREAILGQRSWKRVIDKRMAEITTVTAAANKSNEGWKGPLSSGKLDLLKKVSSQTNFHFLYFYESQLTFIVQNVI